MQVRTLVAETDRRRGQRIALGLVWATIAWNTVEAVVAIVAGAAASSIEARHGERCCDDDACGA
jgi:hypothetical protein